MTGKQIAELALNGQPAERKCSTLVAGGEWCVNHAGATFPEIREDPAAAAAVFVKAFQDLGHDLMWTGAGLLNYPAHALGCPMLEEGAASPALSGPAAESLEQALELDFAGALEHPVVRTVVEHSRLVADKIGEQTLITPTAWGPFTTAARLLGVENLMMATVTEEKALEELLAKITNYLWAMYEQALSHPQVAGINLSEPVASADMISPATFDRFAAGPMATLVGQARALGKYATIHVCGNSTPLLERMAEISPHGFSLESKVDLGKAREVLGGRVCVIGNVSPTGTLLTGVPREVAAETRACRQAWGDAPGFILSVGCDYPRQVPFENLAALLAAGRE